MTTHIQQGEARILPSSAVSALESKLFQARWKV